jgi:nucleotide-binding universal stress UspA family protein
MMQTAEDVEGPTDTSRRPHIVCAARGGQGSQPAVNRAIQLARERDADLTFLFVVDIEFLSHATVGPLSIIHQQLRDMGEFIMATLQAKARESGVTADYAVREGEVREQIRQYLEENQVDALVMGRPVEETEVAVFDAGTVSNFAAALERETGIEVILVSQKDVLVE